MVSVSVLGSGRWGTLIAWYLNKINCKVTLWGKEGTKEIEALLKHRNNGTVFLSEEVKITSDIGFSLKSDYIIISINAQNLKSFLEDLNGDVFLRGGFYNVLINKKIILCMKGIDKTSCKRLTEIFRDVFQNENIAIWVGPGHVKSLISGIPTCMVIDSENKKYKYELSKLFTSNLIKCYVGVDLIGNEIGAAAKNVLGIGAGILDALNMQSLKGPLMSRGALEISNLIFKLGGKKESAYSLCHLGDYEATLFSKESNNRNYGEMLIKGENVNFIAEGIDTACAIKKMAKKFDLKMPIFEEIYKIINKNSSFKESLKRLFSIKIEEEL